MWNIYVVGDAEYIGSVLNALAMMSNSNIFLQLGAIGMLMGTIVIVAGGFVQDGKINIGSWFASLIVLLLMFSFTTTAQVINLRSGTVSVVANVPFGPVAIGSMISRLGKGTTETIQLAFSTPAMTDYGFFTPIKALAKMRQLSVDTAALKNIDDPQHNGSSVLKTVIAYVRDCTAKGIELDQLNPMQMRKSHDFLSAIRWPSDSHFTRVFITPYRNLSCKEAYDVFEPIVRSDYKDELVALVDRQLRSTSEEYRTGGNLNSLGALSIGTGMITGGSVAAGEMVLASVLDRIFELGVIGRYEDKRMYVKAGVIQDSINKRIESWQADASIFEHFFLPVITFLEGISYAMAPFAALAIGLGNKGIKIAANYMLMAVWVQLWMPMLAIINHFTMLISAGALASIHSSGGAGFPSPETLAQIDGELQTWLSVAGMLASSIPFLSAAVLFGGSQLIGKMGSNVSGSGASAGSAGMAAPGLMSQMPVINGTGGLVSDYSVNSGTSNAGASARMASVNIGAQRKAAASEAERSGTQWSETAGTLGARGFANVDSSLIQSAITKQLTSSGGKTNEKFAARSMQIAKELQASGQFTNMDTAQLAGYVAGSFGWGGDRKKSRTEETKKSGAGGAGNGERIEPTFDAPPESPDGYGPSFMDKTSKIISKVLGVNAEIGGKAEVGTGTRQSETTQAAVRDAVNNNEGFKTSLTQALKADASATGGTTVSNLLSATDNKAYSNALSRAKTASAEAANLLESSRTYGGDFVVKNNDFAQRITALANNGDPSTGRKIEDAIANTGVSQQVQRIAGASVARGDFENTEEGRQEARYAAWLNVVNGLGGPTEQTSDQAATGRRVLDSVMEDLYGVNFGQNGTDASGSNDIYGGVAAVGGELVKARATLAAVSAKRETSNLNAEDAAVVDGGNASVYDPSVPEGKGEDYVTNASVFFTDMENANPRGSVPEVTGSNKKVEDLVVNKESPAALAKEAEGDMNESLIKNGSTTGAGAARGAVGKAVEAMDKFTGK